MSKSIKLKNIQPNYEFILIGLVTSEPLYRLSWLVNDNLNIQLKEAPPAQVYHTKRQIIQEFSIFQFDGIDTSFFQLIQNKSQQGFLIEEQKQVDYWLKIENSTLITTDLLAKLKVLKNISLVFEIKPGSLKSKSRLLFSSTDD